MTTVPSLLPRNLDGPEGFRILVVCTANLCRSPIAEALLRSRLSEGAGWTVASAGTQAHVGSRMHPLAEAVLQELGHDPSVFRASQLDRALIAQAHLVLTAERAHRATVVQMHPRAVQYSFTLREMARLVRSVEPAPSRSAHTAGPWLVEQARGNRSGVDQRRLAAEDVTDVIGQPIRAFRRCAKLLDEVATAIAAPLRPAAHAVR